MELLIGSIGGLLVFLLALWWGATLCLPFYVWAIHRRFITLNEQAKEISEVLGNIEVLIYSQMKGKDKAGNELDSSH